MKPRRNLFLGSLLVLALSHSAQADTYNWVGGIGTWDTTTANWTGAGTTWPTTSTLNDDAVFAGTGDVVTIAAGGGTANELTFNTDGYTLSGTAITLDGTTPTITTADVTATTISSVVSGSAGLTKAGLGSLTLSGVNNYTGVTNINAGTLIAGNGAALGSNVDGTTVAANATLDVGGQNLGTEVVTISGAGPSGDGAIVNSGVEQINALGRIVMAGNATIGGGVRWDLRNSTPTLNMAGFTLTKTGANYLGLVGVTISNLGNVIVNEGELNLTFGSTFGLAGATNNITVNSTGILSFYQSSVVHGSTLNLNDGSTLRGENGSGTQNTWAGPINVTGEVTLDADGILNLPANITGTANLTKTGTATAILSGTNNITTTDLTITGGSLQINTAASLPNAPSISVASGANGALVLGNNITVGFEKSITIAGGGTSNGFYGALAAATGNTGTSEWQGSVIIGEATGTRVGSLGGVLHISGNISETNEGSALAIRNDENVNGTVTLSGNNTHTGTTTLSAAGLRIGSATALGSGPLLVDNGGRIASITSTDTTPRTITGATTFNGTGVLTLGDVTRSGKLTFSNTLSLGTAVRPVAVSSEVEFGGIVSGVLGGITKSGSGNLILSGDNSYTGATNINAGTLVAAHANALVTTSAVNISTSTGGGTLRLATDSSVAAYKLASSSNNPGTILSDRATPGAAITHALGAAAFGANVHNFAAGPNVTSGTAGISLASLDLAAGNSNPSTLNPTTANVTIPGSVTIGTNNFAKTLALGGTSTGNLISGVISNGLNTLNVSKIGTGTWTLSNINTYTGTTSVVSGILKLDYATDSSRILDTAALQLAGGTLELSGGNHPELVSGTTLIANRTSTVTRPSGNSVLKMKTITRQGGSFVNFTEGSIATTDTLNTNGILGPWARVGGIDWAVNSTNAADGPITALATYKLTSGALDAALDSAASYTDANITVNSSQAPDGPIAPNSLRFNDPGAFTLTLQGANSIASGGILVTSSVGENTSTITGGTLTGPNNGDLLIFQDNPSGNLVIASQIINTGTTSVVKHGVGAATLSGDNTYTGATTVAGGTLTLSGNKTGNSGAITVSTQAGVNATLNIQNGTYAVGGNNFIVGNAQGVPATGTVNQSGGTVSFSGTTGNGLLLGNAGDTASSGIYNLSGGNINTGTSAANRGVMLGANANSINTFNLSGTGALNMTAATGGTATSMLQIGRYDSGASNTTNTFSQTGGTANVAILSVGGNGTTSTGVVSNISWTAGTFVAEGFPRLAAGNTNTATLTIGGTADVTLPAFPPARGTSSTATLYFDGGTLKPSATSTAYLGGLTNAFIKAGGAKFNTGAFNITVSQNLLTDPVSTGGGLTKEGSGGLTLNGSNTFTGGATLTQGTLNIGHANALGTGPFVNQTNTNTLTNTSGAAITLANSSYSVSSSLIIGGSASTADINTGAGNFTLVGSQRILSVGGGVTATIGGAISGDLRKDGNGTLVLAGTGASLTGIRVVQGNLQLTGSTAATTNLISGHPTGTNIGKLILGGTGGAVNQTFASLKTEGTAQASQSIVGGNASVSTLTINQSTTTTYAGILGGAGTNENNLALVKSGAGTLALTGSTTYTGGTTVNEGTLSLGNGSANTGLADGADVVVAAGATLNLNYLVENTDTVDELWINGVQKSPGVYGASDPSGLITGTGTLTVQNGPSGSDYNTWGAPYGLTTGSENLDLDGDGLTNFEEYAFGLIPNSGASANPITQQLNKGTGTFKYTRRATPATTGVTYTYESSTTLSGTWNLVTPVVPDSTNGTTPVEEITVTVPGAPLTDPKFFIRVKAVK